MENNWNSHATLQVIKFPHRISNTDPVYMEIFDFINVKFKFWTKFSFRLPKKHLSSVRFFLKVEKMFTRNKTAPQQIELNAKKCWKFLHQTWISKNKK